MDQKNLQGQFQVINGDKLTAFGERLFGLAPSAKIFLQEIEWTDEDIVLDIGCGNGYKTVYSVLPLMEKFQRLVAVDDNENIIELAKSKCPAEKLEYRVADIDDISTMEEFRGAITKVVSFECFQYLKNERLAIKNVFALMAPGGEALIHFKTTSPLRDICDDMANQPRWQKYLEDPKVQVDVVRALRRNPEEYFRRLLEEIGFEVIISREEPETLTSANDGVLRVLLNSSCVFMNIPEEEKEDFLDYVFELVTKQHGRNAKGQPLMVYKRLILYFRKP